MHTAITPSKTRATSTMPNAAQSQLSKNATEIQVLRYRLVRPCRHGGNHRGGTVATLEECNGDAGYCDIGWFVRVTAVILTAVTRQTMRTLLPQVEGRFSPERDLTPKTSHQSRVGFWGHLGRIVTLFDVRASPFRRTCWLTTASTRRHFRRARGRSTVRRPV